MTTLREAAQQAKQVPLRELLASVPADARLVIDDADGKGTRSIPVGRLCQEAAAALAEPDTCVWQQDGDSDSGFYGTSCRHYFNLEDGTPEDNKMQWCCYCGKKLAQKLITEDEDD